MMSMSHDEVFYNNVYLLTQVVPTSKDFDALFSKDMFRKQNTPGFLHVSHFLFNIYDISLCKKLIPWPCICKQDETMFRKKFVEFLEVIQDNNPDFLFPSGVASCLFLATGTKFMIIMKLLSIVTLRHFININAGDVFIPYFSQTTSKELIQDLTNMISVKVEENIEQSTKDFEYAQDYIKEQMEEINLMTKQIYEKKNILSKLIKEAPINEDEDRRKLEDYRTNEDVIESWYCALLASFDYLQEGTTVFENLNDLIKKLSIMIHVVIDKPIILDGNCFPQIDIDSISELLDPEFQIISRRLYENDQLVLIHFFKILSKILAQLWNEFLQRDFSGIDTLCEQMGASSEDIQVMKKIIENKQETCVKLYSVIQPKRNRLFDMVQENSLITPMSPLCVQKLTENQKIEHEKKINLTPILRFHEQLFSKYKTESKIPEINVSRDNRVIRVNLDDTMQSFKSDVLTTQRHDRIKKHFKANKEIYQKYSRLFSSGKSLHDDSKLSMLSMISLPKANSTAMHTIGEEPNISGIDLNCEEQSPTKQPECLQDKFELLKNHLELPKQEKQESCNRRSISDLLNRYKAIFKNKSTNDSASN